MHAEHAQNEAVHTLCGLLRTIVDSGSNHGLSEYNKYTVILCILKTIGYVRLNLLYQLNCGEWPLIFFHVHHCMYHLKMNNNLLHTVELALKGH